MAIDITGLTEYIEERPDLVVMAIREDSILQNLSGLEVHEGNCPSTYRAKFYTPEIVLGNCCAPYEGGGTVIEKDFEVDCIQAGDSYCETDLARILTNAASKVKYGAGRENAGSIEQIISEGNKTAFINAINKALLLGDKASADPNLNKFDGWITQALAGGAVELNITQGNLYTAFVQAVLALPQDSEIFGQRLVMFVPMEYGRVYSAMMAANRLFFGDVNGMTIPGVSDVEIVPVRALNGTNQIFLTPVHNLLAITSIKEDLYVYDWYYFRSREIHYYAWYMKGCLGAGIYMPEYSVVANIDPTVASNITGSFDVNILNNPLVVSNDGTFAGPTA